MGVISTIAGTGIASFSGDSGLATLATLITPRSMALDAAGNIYIADFGNNRIRLVTKSTGVISTIAGDGTASFSGDGGQATSATLSGPTGVALDAAGNVYIADNENHRIRLVINSTGVISTIGGTGLGGFSGDGGQATSAKLNYPFSIALDATGNVYIGDFSNQRIRLITKSTSAISTIAGTGTQSFSGDGRQATSATLNQPSGVALDTVGNLYVVDCGNQRIRPHYQVHRCNLYDSRHWHAVVQRRQRTSHVGDA